jgi:hypothetical protein
MVDRTGPLQTLRGTRQIGRVLDHVELTVEINEEGLIGYFDVRLVSQSRCNVVKVLHHRPKGTSIVQACCCVAYCMVFLSSRIECIVDTRHSRSGIDVVVRS